MLRYTFIDEMFLFSVGFKQQAVQTGSSIDQLCVRMPTSIRYVQSKWNCDPNI